MVLASGTLAPLGLLQRQLFPNHPLSSLHIFACGHVVPSSHLLLLPLPSGPSGLTLDLRHTTRSHTATMDELGQLLLNVCQAVPQVMLLIWKDRCWHKSLRCSRLTSLKLQGYADS